MPRGEWPQFGDLGHHDLAKDVHALQRAGPFDLPLGRANDRHPVVILQHRTEPVEHVRVVEIGAKPRRARVDDIALQIGWRQVRAVDDHQFGRHLAENAAHDMADEQPLRDKQYQRGHHAHAEREARDVAGHAQREGGEEEDEQGRREREHRLTAALERLGQAARVIGLILKGDRRVNEQRAEQRRQQTLRNAPRRFDDQRHRKTRHQRYRVQPHQAEAEPYLGIAARRFRNRRPDGCALERQVDLGHGMGDSLNSHNLVAMQHVRGGNNYKRAARACAGYRMIRAEDDRPEVQVPAASSPRACRNTSRLPQIASPAMIAATARSGQLRPVPNTPSAAPITARLPIASFREQIHTERILASPVR